MSRDLEYLTYHEKRRLDYLHSNYHYLNEREQLEYNYLLKKSQGAFVEETDTPRAFEEEEVPDELEEVRGRLLNRLVIFLSTNRAHKSQRKMRPSLLKISQKNLGKRFVSSGSSSGLLSFSCSLLGAWSSCL